MILYLGLDPSRFPRKEGLYHYPVIRTEKLFSKALVETQLLWPQFTHVIFTSITAVRYWEGPLDGKTILAVGKATEAELRKRGAFPITAREETQEGVVTLLQEMDLLDAFVFLPRSKRARAQLVQYLRGRSVRFFALDLYDTVLQKIEPVPPLEGVKEIVFTSPSTVDGFLNIYGSLPEGVALTSIGPITRSYLKGSQCDR